MSPRTALALLGAAACALVTTGCPKNASNSAKRPLTPEEQLRADVASLEAQAREAIARMDEALWAWWTAGALERVSAFSVDTSHLYTREAIEAIGRLRDRTEDPLYARALEQLRLHFVSEYLARETSEASEALSNAVASREVKVGEDVVGWNELDRALARERNALRRKALYHEAMKAAEALEAPSSRLRARQREVLGALGYEDVRTFAAELRRTDLEVVRAQAEQLLEATGPTFRAVLERLATRELRMPVDRVRTRDLPRMFRAQEADEHFPAEALHRRVVETLRGMNIELAGLPNLTVDGEDRPAKNPAPLAVAVEVPGDVRLSFKPAAGVRALSAYLNEVGHALHAAYTTERRYALAKLGAGAPARAWSTLMQRLVEDPVWLKRRASLSDEQIRSQVESAAAWELYLLRQDAARLLFAWAVHAEPDRPAREHYQTIQARALLVPIEAEELSRAELEIDDFFASAGRLEAAFLAAQLESQLKARFGPAWWEVPAAGAWLRQLWAHGNALNGEELAREAGDQGISPEALILRLNTALRFRPESHR